jgi:hypothetical protein
MSYSGTNQWGPYTTQDSSGAEYPNYKPLVGTATPPSTGLLAPAQSPSGSVTNQAATFNYNNTITSTREMIDITLNVYAPQSGTVWLTNATVVSNQPTNFSLRNCVNLGN